MQDLHPFIPGQQSLTRFYSKCSSSEEMVEAEWGAVEGGRSGLGGGRGGTDNGKDKKIVGVKKTTKK